MNGFDYRVRRKRGDDQASNVTVAKEQIGSIAADCELRAGEAHWDLSGDCVRCGVDYEHIARRGDEWAIADVAGEYF